MKRLFAVVGAIQLLLGIRVIWRLIRTSSGARIAKREAPVSATAAVLLPVLNERGRVGSCLAGLTRQGDEVAEILVIDGGSTDGTLELIAEFGAHDPRIRLIEISPPPGENGKAHGLEAGYQAARQPWILTIDADVRPQPLLARSLLAHAERERVLALGVATRQRLSDFLDGGVHPAMLATLIYRFGIPGHATSNPAEVQANGQCFLVQRDLLDEVGGFAAVAGAIAEDVELARAIASHGHRVGFYEAGDLVDVEMYGSGWETWRNWSRSLPLRDRYSGFNGMLGLAEVALVQAAPLWLTLMALKRSGLRGLAFKLNFGLAATRAGVLVGARRAYLDPPPSYWLSPLFDLPVAAQLVAKSIRREHAWRGRTIVRGGIR